MATLSNADLLKRDNAQKLFLLISNQEAFKLGQTGTSGEATATGKVQIFLGNDMSEFGTKRKLKIENVNEYLKYKKNKRMMIEVNLKSPKVKKLINLTQIFKSKNFGGTNAKSGSGGSERQERGLVDAVMNAKLEKGKSVWVDSLGNNVSIIQAMKNDKKEAGNSYIPHLKAGKEPYTDLILNVVERNKQKQLRVSMKGDSAPSLAGGGLSGLMDIDSDMTRSVWNKAINYIKKKGFKQGDTIKSTEIPDLSIKIPDDLVKKVVIGTTEIGGPITHMYIGPMDVTSNYNKTSGQLNVNGRFYSVDEYLKKIPSFYIVIRKRDIDPSGQIKIDIEGETTNQEGLPVLMKNPKTNKNNTRVIVTNSPRGVTI